jgi:hypothetical protein
MTKQEDPPDVPGKHLRVLTKSDEGGRSDTASPLPGSCVLTMTAEGGDGEVTGQAGVRRGEGGTDWRMDACTSAVAPWRLPPGRFDWDLKGGAPCPLLRRRF